MPVKPGPSSAASNEAEFVPPFPWHSGLDQESLSTKRGFVFQFPPFGTLEPSTADQLPRR